MLGLGLGLGLAMVAPYWALPPMLASPPLLSIRAFLYHNLYSPPLPLRSPSPWQPWYSTRLTPSCLPSPSSIATPGPRRAPRHVSVPLLTSSWRTWEVWKAGGS